MYFRLGALYDELKLYDIAFENYRQANELAGDGFDHTSSQQYIEKIINGFSRRNFLTFPRATNDSDLPVFIVGLPRAGKTIAEQVLASHPQITGAGELEDVSKIVRVIEKDSGKDFPLALDRLPVSRLDDYANEYLAKRETAAFPGSTRVVDTMPGNFNYLGLIRMLFPNARIIHCIRNPLDQCMECYFKDFLHADKFACASSLADMAFYYNQYMRLMRHWQETLELPLLEVQYEALVQEPETTCRELLDFVGLTWDQQCLDFYTSGYSQVIGNQEIREPLHTRFVGRWKNYEQHLQPLKEVLSLDS